MRILINLNDAAAKRGLATLAAKGRDLRPLMQDIGEEMHRAVEKNFAVGGRPTPWKPSARSKREGGKPLTDNGVLRRSITVDADSQSVRVGTNVKYGPIHQFGGDIKRAARSEIFIRNRARSGRFSKGTKSGQGFTFKEYVLTIPARPFLVIPDADKRRIEQIAADYMKG